MLTCAMIRTETHSHPLVDEEGGPGELGAHDGETEMLAGSSWGHNPRARQGVNRT
jgi:hypothetical protein